MRVQWMWLPILILGLSGCAGMSVNAQKGLAAPKAVAWTVLPFANNTETPLANARAAALAASMLQSDGQRVVGSLPIDNRSDALLGGDWKKDYERALASAREQGAHYALGGTVEEWDYRVGVNAEPVVSLTLWVVDTDTGKVVWSGAGSAHGGSLGNQGTGSVAQGLIHRLLDRALG